MGGGAATGKAGDAEVPRAVLVAVGDELLLGRTVDSNSAWLSERLASIGIEVVAGHTVGDDDRGIRRALGEALDEADVVIFTGGLGPTSDDRTKGVVAEALGLPLREDEEMLEELGERFRRRGYERMPASNRTQAEVPEGARVLVNPRGTAPGLVMDVAGRAEVVLLPGVPDEMKGIFEDHLAGFLRSRFGDRLRPVHHRTLYTTGIPESELAGRVESALAEGTGPVAVAFLPDVTGVELRLTARDVDSVEEARTWFDRVEAALEEPLRGHRYEAPESGDLAEAVGARLVEDGRTLAVAESCTGGLIAKRLTDRAGASRFFLGGVVAYSDEAKVAFLDVDRAALEEVGAVSETVARQMAAGVARAFGAECAVGITGVAGPEGGTEQKPVGLVFYAASVGERTEVGSAVFPGDRRAVRARSAQAALALLDRLLREEP